MLELTMNCQIESPLPLPPLPPAPYKQPFPLLKESFLSIISSIQELYTGCEEISTVALMPYTPPSQQSPSSSASQTPVSNRSQANLNGLNVPPNTIGRPELPRSASYLQRHRRTPSLNTPTKSSLSPNQTLNSVEEPQSKDLAVKPVTFSTSSTPAGENEHRKAVIISDSIRQSPQPQTDSAVPAGAVMSPPDSSQNSSDDESNLNRRRGRNLENLAELQAAIRIIEQHRESSPTRRSEELRKVQAALDNALPGLKSAITGPLANTSSSTPPLSQSARKISHSRSSTESAIINGPEDGSPSDSDAEDDGIHIKPPMIRKKSGELVKPALRPSFGGRRRPSSMPGTPTYSKAVHFDSHLEHVRHFLQVDRPVAVSAGSSPVETYESDSEFPLVDEGRRSRSPPFEWELSLSNFPRDTDERRRLPIRVERVFLSSDKKNLVGNVIVANLSYHKSVVIRFTLDYWKTTSEVVADYNNDVRRKDLADGHDRFNFSIKLSDQTNLENKTLVFCVRYNVNGQEYWDNNGNINFQADFKKKLLPQGGKSSLSGLGARPLNALPRSRPSTSSSSGRPRSMPTSFDDFAGGFEARYEFGNPRQASSQVIGEAPLPHLKLKTKNSSSGQEGNNSSMPFSNRYDFGASLSAAISAAASKTDRNESRDEWRPNQKYFSPHAGATKGLNTEPAISSSVTGNSGPNAKAPGLTSEKPSLQSSSYHELLDKYCFFGSAKSSPKLNEPSSGSGGPQTDGASDVRPVSTAAKHVSAPVKDAAVPMKSPETISARVTPAQTRSPVLSRSTSPTPSVGSGLGSPVSFGYPYHGTHTGFPFGETQPTAIRG